MFSLTTGSRPIVGSSRNKTLGSCIKEATISHLILCPKLKFLTGVFMKSSNSNSVFSSSIFFSTLDSGIS